jgi:hypothetical protein
VLGN